MIRLYLTGFKMKIGFRMKSEYEQNQYLSEEKRRLLSIELGLTESQVKIWFQNKRAKQKKRSSSKEEKSQSLVLKYMNGNK